jgi:starch-binding outer membrane protein, SusD/RagB family
LPVTAYNSDHTSATFGGAYNENQGTNPYLGRDIRLRSSIVFNTTKYGKYKGQPAAAPELVIYTYEGKAGTGFNINTVSQLETDKRLSCTGYYLRKFNSASYWGSTAGGTSAHKIFFRLAEVYLNLAEANCELNKLDEAIAALDMVRVRAGQPAISNVPGFSKTKDFLMKRIRNERRVELCFEGHRFHDQRRWKILDQTNGVISGMKITSAGTANKDLGPFSYERVKIETVRNATSDKYLVLPIPQNESRKLTGLGQPAAWQ